jgi:GT2 family glycosyltransferase
MEPGVSVIIVTYNSAETIFTCVDSVLKSLGPDDEVIIVDNHSHDNTVEIVKQIAVHTQNNVEIFKQTENCGFAKGCNIGIDQSNKEFIVLLNPDTEVFGDWLHRLLAHFHFYKNTGAVGPLSNYANATQHITTYCPNYLDYTHDASGLIESLYRKFKLRSVPVKLLIGFCMALRRDILQLYRGLDEDFFLGIEDLELSWRLREKGFLLRVALDVFVNHAGHVSFNTLPKPQTDQYTQKGADILYEKMRSYYRPDKVPNPKDYFGISWWKPSVLKVKSEEEAFAPKLQKRDYDHILAEVKKLIQNRGGPKAIQVLHNALKIFVNDYLLWYTLGSLYFAIGNLEKAEYALKNAWALECNSDKAKNKLVELFNCQDNRDEVHEIFGEVVR